MVHVISFSSRVRKGKKKFNLNVGIIKEIKRHAINNSLRVMPSRLRKLLLPKIIIKRWTKSRRENRRHLNRTRLCDNTYSVEPSDKVTNTVAISFCRYVKKSESLVNMKKENQKNPFSF